MARSPHPSANLAVLALLLLTVPSLGTGLPPADISAPNKVPQMSGFKTPVIVPGDRGTLNFTLTNRYAKPMTGPVLTIEIYKYATLDFAQDLDEVDHPPEIVEGSAGSYRLPLGPSLLPKSGTDIRLRIGTSSETPEGTYFVRTMVVFGVNGTNYTMKSRGYFDNPTWERATKAAGNDSVAGINLTLLQVDGIVVDTSFSVRRPIPLWPLFVLIGAAVLFAALAFVYYLVEEEPGHPWVKKYFYRLAGRVKARQRLREQERKERERRPGPSAPPKKSDDSK